MTRSRTRLVFAAVGLLCLLFVLVLPDWDGWRQMYLLYLAACVYGFARTYFMDASWRRRLDSVMLSCAVLGWAIGATVAVATLF